MQEVRRHTMSYKTFPVQEKLKIVLYHKDSIQNIIQQDTYDVFDKLPDEISDDQVLGLPEGAVQKIIVNKYERNSINRLSCISFYKKVNGGYVRCEICGFNFSMYGEQFCEKINIHHTKQLSQIGPDYVSNPIRDLIPVCPNCHLILHSKSIDEAYTCEEVKGMLARR